MEDAVADMNVWNLSSRMKYEPDNVSRNHAPETVSSDGEACHSLAVILQLLHSGENLECEMRSNRAYAVMPRSRTSSATRSPPQSMPS